MLDDVVVCTSEHIKDRTDSSGAVGLVVTMVFICFSAPDLALTQITVDVVTTVFV